MNRAATVFLAGLLIALPATALPADAPVTSMSADQARFLYLTHALEDAPFEQEKSTHAWMIQWVTDSPDVNVLVCDILWPVPGKDLPYGPELLVQSMYGNAAFQIEHPDQKNDQLVLQLAGVASALKTYSAILVEHPEAKIPYFDQLLTKQADGSLKAFMAPIIKKNCKRP